MSDSVPYRNVNEPGTKDKDTTNNLNYGRLQDKESKILRLRL